MGAGCPSLVGEAPGSHDGEGLCSLVGAAGVEEAHTCLAEGVLHMAQVRGLAEGTCLVVDSSLGVVGPCSLEEGGRSGHQEPCAS